MREDTKYWVAMTRVSGIGANRFKKIYSYFDSMETAWGAGTDEWRRTGLDAKIIDDILYKKQEINPDEEMEKMLKEDVRVVTILDDDYPKLLKEIHDPPGVLYYKGNLVYKDDKFAVGVVGTRKFSSYGKQVTEEIVADLAGKGIVIVSGLALGIDSLAHKAALDQDGRTIAIIGSGLDKQNIYPSMNRYMVDKIAQSGGLVLSEYPMGTMPLKQNFPQRNRIVSGLSRGILVVEAPASSGALITAKLAVDQNRDVFAIPGNIYHENSEGPHNLIKLGAKLVARADDILEALDLSHVSEIISNKKIKADSKEEELILELLSMEPMHINEIVKNSSLDIGTVNSTIVLMEMRGKVKNLGSMMYIKAK